MSAREQSELERAVRIMRDAQKAYFADRRTDDLEAARRAEREVDRILRELDAPQQRLAVSKLDATVSRIETTTESAFATCEWCDSRGCDWCDGTGERIVFYRACRVCGLEVEACGGCGEDECGCTSMCTCPLQELAG